jgi:hypothetical protein
MISEAKIFLVKVIEKYQLLARAYSSCLRAFQDSIPDEHRDCFPQKWIPGQTGNE